MATKASRATPVLLTLLVLLGLGLLPPLTASTLAANPGDGLAVEGNGPTLTSTVNGIEIMFGKEFGKTTIWMRVCADAPSFQLRSEQVGQWMTEVFYRTATAGGCSPSPTSWWRMVYNADPNPSQIFRIFAYASDVVLTEPEFMTRAARTDCYVTAYGAGFCTPGNPVPPWPNARGAIDQPTEGQSVVGSVSVGGWVADAGAFSSPGITDVHVAVNGTFVGAATYGGSRPDVAAALSDSRFTNTGFAFSFDIASFSPGPTTIQVGFRRALDGVWTTMERHIVIAQTIGTLSGQVTNASGGAPIVGAVVSLGSRLTRTDTAGTYSFNGLQPGTYALGVTANGYSPTSLNLNLTAGPNTRTIALTPLSTTGFRVPTSPIVSYGQQDGMVNSVTAYFDLNSANSRIHDAAHPVGSTVRIDNRTYTAPWPASIWRLGLAYNGHVGTDYNGRLGQTAVVAAAPGYVISWRDGSPNGNLNYPGNTVWMRHPNVKGRDVCVLYHHLSPGTITAKVRSIAGRNILVPAGESLAYVGNSGYSFGAHLHFEVYDCANTRLKLDPYASGLMENWVAPAALLAAEPTASLVLTATASALLITPSQTITVSVQASADVAQYRWILDTGEEVAGPQATVSFSEVGTHQIWVSAVGVNGEDGLAEPLTFSVTPQAGQAGLDLTAPTGSISATAATATATTTLSLALADGEPTASAKMRFSTDGVTYTPWEQFAPTRVWNLPTTEGNAVIFAQFADAAGNSAEPVIAVVQVDRTAPTISITDPITDTSQPWQVTVAWGVEDLGVEAHGLIKNEYQLVGVDSDWQVAGVVQQAVYRAIPSGTYTLRVRVTDLAGNATTLERQMNLALARGAVYLPLVLR